MAANWVEKDNITQWGGFTLGNSILPVEIMRKNKTAGEVSIPGESPVYAPELYPNPSTGQFVLVINSNTAKAKTLSLYTQEGKLVQQKKVNAFKGLNKITWDVSHLPAGTYILADETGIISKKVIRQ